MYISNVQLIYFYQLGTTKLYELKQAIVIIC